MKSQEVNVGTAERIVRVIGGGLVATTSVALLVGGSSLWAAGLEIAGIALGIDFIYTGIRGYCPLYHRLGWRTARASRR